ncbi:hypothetical protein, partial [uncultured Bacteroides sp.]|uniref:hypothetical protein n=1 Tax=uncultured Bacteroides sp. TaxID=162156 RepID=UPI0025B6FE8A
MKEKEYRKVRNTLYIYERDNTEQSTIDMNTKNKETRRRITQEPTNQCKYPDEQIPLTTRNGREDSERTRVKRTGQHETTNNHKTRKTTTKKNRCQNRQGELINTIKKGLRAGVNFLQKVFSASSQASFRSVFL